MTLSQHGPIPKPLWGFPVADSRPCPQHLSLLQKTKVKLMLPLNAYARCECTLNGKTQLNTVTPASCVWACSTGHVPKRD